jgi:hypothetical protein
VGGFGSTAAVKLSGLMVGRRDMKNVQCFFDGSYIRITIHAENFVIVLLLALLEKFLCTLDTLVNLQKKKNEQRD